MLDYDRNARAPNSGWLIVVAGALLAWLMLQAAPTLGQSVANLAWFCANTSSAGTPTNDTNCSSAWRWDYGDSPGLVAACLTGNCTTYAQGRWTAWADVPANATVWVNKTARFPGPYSGTSSEGYVPKAQVALNVTAPPPPPPPPTPLTDVHMTATPGNVIAGDGTTLAWTSQNAGSCTGTWTPDPVPVNGTVIVTLTVPTEFTVLCQPAPGAIGVASSTVSVGVVSTPWAPPTPPPCYPGPNSAAVLREQSTVDGHTVKAWACDAPDGYYWRTIGFDPARTADKLDCVPLAVYHALATGSSLAEAFVRCVDRPLSPTERVVADVLTQRWQARFVVSALAATAACPVGCRPVYLRNADGTRGARVVIGGVNQSIESGQTCDGRRRLSGTTRYHEISGLTSVTGQTLPADSFTVCTIQNPPANGWLP